MTDARIANCIKCDKHTYVSPLHDDKGGPLMCPICAGKWHGEHNRRRKWGRIVIKAMKMYQHVGGRWTDLDKLKLAAGGMAEAFGIDLLGYGETDTIGTEVGDITSELLTDAIQLTHPDKHPPEREELARRVTQELLALKPFVFPAPKPKPAEKPKPRDTSFKVTQCDFKKPSRQTFPCEDCGDTIPYFYCDPCRAEWDKRCKGERERGRAKQREWYARRRRWKRYRQKPITCPGCSVEFSPLRKDTKYCSAACRQQAHRQRKMGNGLR